MTTSINTARLTLRTATHTPVWLRALNWLVDRDAAYRASHKLRNMPDERLEDMGITREGANTAYSAGYRIERTKRV